MKVRVKIDKNLCIGSGSCLVVAAEHFDLNEDGKAEIRTSKNSQTKGMDVTLEVTSVGKKKLLEAAMVCPAQAISVIEE